MNREPSYRALYRENILVERVAKAVGMLASCSICPRNCAVNRLAGEQGFCRTGRVASVASWGPHFGEESPLVGRFGSGTIFFSSCNLLCSFCQNDDISQGRVGGEAGPETLAGMMLSLADQGCHNINLVTPTHVVPQILEGLLVAVSRGLNVPLVYNCGGYENLETLEILKGVVDVYMPDFKFWDNSWARYACGVSDYRQHACQALKEMHRQVGDLVLAEDGTAVRGLLVRHLAMPGKVAGTEEVMQFLSHEISRGTYVNVMNQYQPCHRAVEDDVLGRRITAAEYDRALEAAEAAGLKRLDGHRRLWPV